MFNSEIIAGSGSSAVSLDLTNEVKVALNFLIADIREPETRRGSWSKPFRLPGTKKNNKFFEHIYRFNIATQTWNQNLKTPIYILQGGSVAYEGYLRLLQINTKLVNLQNDINYEVSLFGDNKTLFSIISDAKLEDLDVSEYDHTYNRVNQFNSWSAAIGSGYVYPLIDYGHTNNFSTSSYAVEHLRPAFYVKTLWDKIFTAAGKTYTSNGILNSTAFKRLIIPNNGDKFTMSALSLASYEFLAGNSGAITSNTKALTVNTGYGEWFSGDIFTSQSSSYTMKYNDDTNAPFTDPGSRYDTTTGIITIGQSGTYNFQFKTDFEIKISSVPAGTASISIGTNNKWPISYKVLLSSDGGVTWTTPYNDTPNYQLSVITTSFQTISKTWNYSGSFNAGDKLKLLVHPLYSNAGGYGIKFKDGSNNDIITGTASMEWRFMSVATVNAKLSTSNYVSGQALSIVDTIPKDIKQRDFVNSIIKMFNLYIDVDPNNPDNYLIETRDDFYSSTLEADWSEKLAWDKDIEMMPMTEVKWKTLLYNYKQDQDWLNKKYFDANAESYGSFKKIVENDFEDKEIKTEVIFSPTPVVDNSNNSIIIPKIFDYDGTNIKPLKHNIRILRYNGIVPITSGNWTYVAPSSDALGNANLTMSSYPQAAMVDDPLNPTESIEWGVPNEVFYTLGTNYTTNNLYNRFYYRQISEITDRDSKIIVAWVDLSPSDISQFDFRRKIWLKDAYFFVNKIIDYNPLEQGLTKVEFVKIKNYSAYVPTQVTTSAVETNSGNIGMTARIGGQSPEETVSANANSMVTGSNTVSRSSTVIGSGSRNFIGVDCEGIAVVNTDYSTVMDSCSGISMINCSGIYIGASCHEISLFNCHDITIEELTYGFTGMSLNNQTFNTTYNNKLRIGKESTFEFTGTTL